MPNLATWENLPPAVRQHLGEGTVTSFPGFPDTPKACADPEPEP